MRLGRRMIQIEITEIIATNDRCVRATIKRTGKPANFPRFITEFSPGAAWVPAWLAIRLINGERDCDLGGN